MDTKYKEYTYKEKSKEILDIIDHFLEENQIGGSFTNRFKEQNTDGELYELLKILSEKGHNFQIFFKEYKNEILKDSKFTGHCYFVDYLLYKFDESFPIGGLSLEESETDEKVIKYNYGYYKYDLGKKFILQSFNSLEEYFYETAKCFIYSMLVGNEMKCNFQRCLKSIEPDIARSIQDDCSVVQKEHGYSMLIINWNAFMDFLLPYIDSNQSDATDLFISDLKNPNYYYKQSDNKLLNKLLLIFFGPKDAVRFGSTKISEESKEILKEIELKRTANKYNL